ncbi:NAD(P)-dependent dehydrogenase, short-chain alcohol dehydrogenase family, partial [Solimonas aquatica]
QKVLPAEIAAQMQAGMERYTKAKSLAVILAALPQQSAAAAVAAPAVAVMAVAPVAASVDYRSLLIGIVAERTGYPTEMLSLDADLEADLGIDSIKRVEIIGAFQKVLPAEIAAQMQTGMERYTKAKSLSAILAALPSAGAPLAAAATPAAGDSLSVKPGVKASEAAVSVTPRYVMKPRAAPLPKARVKLSGLALLLGGPAALVQALSAALSAEGMTPVAITSSQPQALREAIVAARQQHGAARAVLHLFGMEASQPQNLSEWRGCYQRDILSLFHGLKAVEGDLAQLRAVAATRFGGSFGRDTIDEGVATGGGANGLFNCLRQEYPKSRLRAVDFDGQSEAEIAALLSAELASDCSEPEAGYVDSKRCGYYTAAQPLSASPFPAAVTPAGDWVVLVTGGARGITAEIVEELVRPGMQLVLLGRTAAPGPESADTAACADAAQLKSAILKRRLAAGEKPKPVEIDREVSRVLTDREIRQNLARISAAGAKVEYLACDVRDEAAFAQVIDSLYERHGKIDAVLHGAGVIEDKLFADKTAESFERVLGTKLDPAFVLTQRLRPQSLKLMAFFTSVAGRYGNQGQGDYACANETLNRLAWQLQHAWTQTRVIAINWGPWDAGMASEGVRRAFAERGIEAIPVPSGRRFFLEELLYGPRHDVEIVAGAGPWYSGEAEASEPAAPAGGASLPLLRGAPRMGPGGNMMLDHQFTLESDPYLIDHRLDGKGVLPATAALEWMAQFVSAAWPGWHVIEMRDMRQLNSVMLDAEHEGKRSVQLRARASSHSDFSGQTVTVEIVDPARKLPFYRATAVLLQQPPQAAPATSVAALDKGKPFAAQDAYAHFLFHGPRFQLAREIPAVSAEGLDALLRPTLPGEWLPDAQGRWLFDPGLLDVAPQMAIVWARINRNMTALPSAFASVRRYGSAPLPAQLKLCLRMQPAPHEAAVVYDALFFDERNQLRLEMRGCESTMSAALNRLGGQAVNTDSGKPQESA